MGGYKGDENRHLREQARLAFAKETSFSPTPVKLDHEAINAAVEARTKKKVQLEMIRWFAMNGDEKRKPVTFRHYLLNTVSVYALIRHARSNDYGTR